ncbi:MAG: hypothetical protein IAF38_15420 [Bacteroidia bacterium]|nr:hypothetical protein [Bacteroidia bacterium]
MKKIIGAIALGCMVLFNSCGVKGYSALSSTEIASYRKKAGVIIKPVLFTCNCKDGAEVNLYHSDAPESVFNTWTFKAGESKMLDVNSEGANYGSDWGIQLLIKGKKSKIFFIGDLAKKSNDEFFKIKCSDFKMN